MIARPLAAHSPRAARETLLRHGWDERHAMAAATSLEPVVILLEQVPESVLEALIGHNRQLGLDLLTGEGWVLLAGSRSRLAGFARPWVLPPELAELAALVGQALPGEVSEAWTTARAAIPLDRPIILGILNLTPDSFSDGGTVPSVDAAVARARELCEAGADILDLGGESTRPGASAVPESEELRRVLPVVEALERQLPGVPLSVDTVKAGVAREVLKAGAAIINDVSTLRLDPAMGEVVAAAGAGVVLMHSRGDVATMASTADTGYEGPVAAAVAAELRPALDRALMAGISMERIVVDPGLGFAKTAEQSLELLDQLGVLSSLNRPVLVGPSRKRFLGQATGRPVEDRDRATAAACVLAWDRGARLFRVHDPRLAREALQLAARVTGAAASLPG